MTTEQLSDEALSERLMSPVDISDLATERDEEKVNAIVFELYKEAASVVDVAGQILDDAAAAKGGWPRNQAICAGLLIRISKLMLVVTQLGATKNRGEVVIALSRSILESSINLEFLVRANDDKLFDQFVTSSLGTERELYDLIQANVAARNGEVLPIEKRMLKSIAETCQVSGVKIEDLSRKRGDWGGGLRERLRTLRKEEIYAVVQRTPSHHVHGTWVDLYLNHLRHDANADVFMPNRTFSWVDARLLEPIAIFVLDAVDVYLRHYFATVELLLARILDLRERIHEAGSAHERLISDQA